MSGTTTATVDTVVNAAITELSQVPGQATQIYSTPRMTQYVQNAVLLELEEMWWPSLMYYIFNVPIDAVTGVPAADLVDPLGGFLESYTDICAVWPNNSNQKLTSLPRNINPRTLLDQTNQFYIGPSAVARRPLMVWPPYSHDVTIWARHRPTLPMIGTDRVWMDQLLILYDVCWMYAVDDGTIPAQVNKFQVLAANRRKRMKAAEHVHSTPLDPTTYSHMEDTFFVLDADPLA
jgi:hypothetical protein